MSPGPFAHRIHPAAPVTPLPAKPEDVGCVCGLYEPKRHACLTCYLVATTPPTD